MSGNKAEFYDYVDLALLRLSKFGRVKLTSDANQAEFYEEFFTELDFSIRNAVSDPRVVPRVKVMREVVAQHVPQGAQVLDVGCGLGDNLLSIHRDDLQLHGVEYSSTSARRAMRVLGNRAEVHNVPAAAMPFDDGRFQFAMCIEVLEHIPEELPALREINRVLPVGGKFMMSVPYRHWFPAYSSLMGHLRHYTRSGLTRLLEEHGFAVVAYLPNFPRWTRYANYCYVACRVLAGAGRLFGRKSGPTDMRLPFMKQPLLQWMLGKLVPLHANEGAMDYSTLETSTFILATKKRSL